MADIRLARHLVSVGLMSLLINGCFHPPYNNFKPYNRVPRDMATGAGVGTVAGAAAGTTLIGTGIGTAVFTGIGLYKDSKPVLMRNLKKANIQYIRYGDTNTLIVPTDRFYLFNSSRFNEACYPGLHLIVRLIKLYPNSKIYVAGFTDNIGSVHHKKKLSQARAETMLTFLWANGVKAERLDAQGYGDKFDISDNSIIHGSAQNRRVEIQWFDNPPPQAPSTTWMGPTK